MKDEKGFCFQTDICDCSVVELLSRLKIMQFKLFKLTISHHAYHQSEFQDFVKLLALALTNLVLDLAYLATNLAKPSLG